MVDLWDQFHFKIKKKICLTSLYSVLFLPRMAFPILLINQMFRSISEKSDCQLFYLHLHVVFLYYSSHLFTSFSWPLFLFCCFITSFHNSHFIISNSSSTSSFVSIVCNGNRYEKKKFRTICVAVQDLEERYCLDTSLLKLRWRRRRFKIRSLLNTLRNIGSPRANMNNTVSLNSWILSRTCGSKCRSPWTRKGHHVRIIMVWCDTKTLINVNSCLYSLSPHGDR